MPIGSVREHIATVGERDRTGSNVTRWSAMTSPQRRDWIDNVADRRRRWRPLARRDEDPT
jgi:hypothetical protein